MLAFALQASILIYFAPFIPCSLYTSFSFPILGKFLHSAPSVATSTDRPIPLLLDVIICIIEPNVRFTIAWYLEEWRHVLCNINKRIQGNNL